MSLHFTLRVNGHGIYHAVDITRLDRTDHPDQDSVYRYRVCAVNENGTDPARQFRATFTHRYGDGAFECVRKALNAMYLEPGWIEHESPPVLGGVVDMTDEEFAEFREACRWPS